MKLVDDWRRVLRRAWSVRLALLAALFDGLAAIWFSLADTLPVGLFATLGVGINVAAALARIIEQPRLRK